MVKVWPKPHVISIDVEQEIAVGCRLAVKGKRAWQEFDIASMELDKASIERAQPGQKVGMKGSSDIAEGISEKQVVYEVRRALAPAAGH